MSTTISQTQDQQNNCNQSNNSNESNESNESNNSEEEMNYPLKENWTLWFHKVDDNNWTPESYQEIYTLDDLEDFHAMFNTFFNTDEKMTATAGMFFLMKDGIPPIWEDPKNINGGMWTYKAPKKLNHQFKSDKIWIELCGACVGMSLTKNVEDMKYINGISISPKLDNCIFKIWTNDYSISDPNIITDKIEGIDATETIHKAFKQPKTFKNKRTFLEKR